MTRGRRLVSARCADEGSVRRTTGALRLSSLRDGRRDERRARRAPAVRAVDPDPTDRATTAAAGDHRARGRARARHGGTAAITTRADAGAAAGSARAATTKTTRTTDAVQ